MFRPLIRVLTLSLCLTPLISSLEARDIPREAFLSCQEVEPQILVKVLTEPFPETFRRRGDQRLFHQAKTCWDNYRRHVHHMVLTQPEPEVREALQVLEEKQVFSQMLASWVRIQNEKAPRPLGRRRRTPSDSFETEGEVPAPPAPSGPRRRRRSF